MRIIVYTDGTYETESFDEAVAMGIEKNFILKEIDAPRSACYEADAKKINEHNKELWISHGRPVEKFRTFM